MRSNTGDTPPQHVCTLHSLQVLRNARDSSRQCGYASSLKHTPLLIISVTVLQLNIVGISSPSSSFICQYFLVMNVPQVTFPSRHSCAAYCTYLDCKYHWLLEQQQQKPLRWLLWLKEGPQHRLAGSWPAMLPTLHWPTSAVKRMVISDKGNWLDHTWTIAGSHYLKGQQSIVALVHPWRTASCITIILQRIHTPQENYI